MEKLDALVAIAGGAILVIAVAGAYVSGSISTSPYDLAFAQDAHSHDATLALAPTGGDASAEVDVGEANVLRMSATVWLNATLFPSGGDARLVLTSPEGSVTEAESSVDAGGTAILLEAFQDVATAPAARRVDAASEEEAERAAWAENATAGRGAWTIEVSFAPGPVPPADLVATLVATYSAWHASADPVADGSR